MADIPEYDFSFKKGDNEDIDIFLYDDEAGTLPTDLTGWSAKLQLREKENTNPIIDLDDVAEGIVLGGVTGKITLKGNKIRTDIAAATTIVLPFNGVYDLETTDNSENTLTRLTGTITILPDYTA